MNDKHELSNELKVNHVTEENRPVRWMSPMVDIYDNSKEVVLIADLPGVVEKDLQLEVASGVLTLEAPVTVLQEDDRRGYYRRFKLSDQIDSDSGNAELKDGVLTMRLPKVVEAQPKKIAVKTLH
jgi:HSP20 family molecular chaperone IbpA